MIRVVLDTNIVISGTLWSGTPSLVLQSVRQRRVHALTSEALLDELKEVLERAKFAARLRLIDKTSTQIVTEYAALAEITEVEVIERTVPEDEDDDQVIACAFIGQADYIVSGDPHLLELKQYKLIPIVTAIEFLALLTNNEQESET